MAGGKSVASKSKAKAKASSSGTAAKNAGKQYETKKTSVRERHFKVDRGEEGQ